MPRDNNNGIFIDQYYRLLLEYYQKLDADQKRKLNPVLENIAKYKHHPWFKFVAVNNLPEHFVFNTDMSSDEVIYMASKLDNSMVNFFGKCSNTLSNQVMNAIL